MEKEALVWHFVVDQMLSPTVFISLTECFLHSDPKIVVVEKLDLPASCKCEGHTLCAMCLAPDSILPLQLSHTQSHDQDNCDN